MSKTILIADDDPEILRVLTLEFKNAGYDVITARSGSEALELMGRNRPDFMVLDNQMPEGDGVSVISRMKSVVGHAAIPVIILTAHDSTALRQKAMRLNARAVFAKPFPPSAVLKEIQGIIGNP